MTSMHNTITVYAVYTRAKRATGNGIEGAWHVIKIR